jgi:carbon-monoxide dehydrogenase medium subunit
MYPPSFDYRAARSLEEVLELLTERGDEAKILAGGQSLIPLIKLRFAAPTMLVDLNGVEGLGDIGEDDNGLRIGALVRHRDVVDSEVITTRYPAMAAAAPLISDPLIRNRGTIAGSLAHADPAADWASVMLALGAHVHVRSTGGERDISIDDFLQGPFTTTLDPSEVITEVVVPHAAARSGGTYLKLERRVGDFATVGAAVHLVLSNGTVATAGIALTAVGPRNIRATDAEAVLAGSDPTSELLDEAADLASRAAQPADDVRGTAEYKRNVVRVFVRRGLDRALELARAS